MLPNVFGTRIMIICAKRQQERTLTVNVRVKAGGPGATGFLIAVTATEVIAITAQHTVRSGDFEYNCSLSPTRSLPLTLSMICFALAVLLCAAVLVLCGMLVMTERNPPQTKGLTTTNLITRACLFQCTTVAVVGILLFSMIGLLQLKMGCPQELKTYDGLRFALPRHELIGCTELAAGTPFGRMSVTDWTIWSCQNDAKLDAYVLQPRKPHVSKPLTVVCFRDTNDNEGDMYDVINCRGTDHVVASANGTHQVPDSSLYSHDAPTQAGCSGAGVIQGESLVGIHLGVEEDASAFLPLCDTNIASHLGDIYTTMGQVLAGCEKFA